MKIQVVKKGTTKIKTMAACPFFIDEPPPASK